jgi:hypothetical protein
MSVRLTEYNPRASFEATEEDKEFVRVNAPKYRYTFAQHLTTLSGDAVKFVQDQPLTDSPQVDQEMFTMSKVRLAITGWTNSLREHGEASTSVSSIVNCTHIDPKLRDAALKVFLSIRPIGEEIALYDAYKLSDPWIFDLLLHSGAQVSNPLIARQVLEKDDEATLQKLIEHGLDPSQQLTIAQATHKERCVGLLMSPQIDATMTTIEHCDPRVPRDALIEIARFAVGSNDVSIVRDVVLPRCTTTRTPMEMAAEPADTTQ